MEMPNHIGWPGASDNELYTIIMLDPDAPNRRKPRPGAGLHWLIVNVPGTHVDQGDTLATYFGAGPPENSGPHRYLTRQSLYLFLL